LNYDDSVGFLRKEISRGPEKKRPEGEKPPGASVWAI
jgi:hypothetical protein